MEVIKLASNVRKKLIIIGFLLTTVLIFYISLPIITPFIFVGPAPFFTINNHDVKGHEVTVEVFDKNNKLIMNETYSLEPKGSASLSRPFSLRFYQEKREYTFKVSMDKQITKTVKTEIPDMYTFVYINLYYQDYESPEIIPIFIVTTGYC